MLHGARLAASLEGKRVRRPVSRVLFRPKDGDDHSSGPAIADRFSRPTRTPRAVSPASRSPRDVPIRSCSRRGLPCRPCCQARGGLLPHPFTLPCPEGQAVCFLWRYPSGRPGRKLSAAISPWSPDFPRREQAPAATARPSDGGQMGLLSAAVNLHPPLHGEGRRGDTLSGLGHPRTPVGLSAVASCSTPIRVARVSPSAMPSTVAGRQ